MTMRSPLRLVLAVAAAVVAVACSAPTPPAPALEGDALEQTRSLFNMICANCHLQAGTGDPRRKSAGIPDFTDPAWHETRTDAQLRESLANGKGAVMPAFGTRLSPEQLDHLVRYVRDFPRR